MTLFNPSATDYGRSADNVLAAMRAMNPAYALVRDSGKLAEMCASVGMQVLFRAVGDDPAGNPLASDPTQFVNARINEAPSCGYVHLSNEIGFTDPRLNAWTLAAMHAAEARGKKVVAFNAATNQPLNEWKLAESAIRTLYARGHKVGVHLYLDGTHDDGGFVPLDWLRGMGVGAFVTEYAYIHSVFDALTGWRADKDAAGYRNWLEIHAVKLSTYRFPAFIFSLSAWPDDDQGRRTGFGTEDHAELQAAAALLNARYPLQGVPPVPTYPPGSDPAPKRIALPAGLNLRDAPSTGAKVLRTMAYQELVTVYAAPMAQADGYLWQRVIDSKDNAGWSASIVAGQPGWTDAAPNPSPTPPPAPTWTVRLDVPFVSQIDGTSAKSNNDCGVASLLMLTRYALKLGSGLVADVPTVDDLIQYTALADRPLPKGLTFAQIGALAARLGFKLAFVQPMTPELIRQRLDDGRPVMALVDYSVLFPGKPKIAHILVVHSYDADGFCVHDPYQMGANVTVSTAALANALAASPGNAAGFQGALLAT